MDVDEQDDGQRTESKHAYPSPLEAEQLQPVLVQTDGPEQGTQVDKVDELSPGTTFIRLVDDDRGGPETLPVSPVDTENAPVLLQCEWNPRDSSILAAAGTDALARIWTISRATTGQTGQTGYDHVSPRAHSLLPPDAPRRTTATALSWTSDGTAIAVATDSGSQAAVSIWSADGTHMQTMEVSEPPIIKLSWNPGNTALLAISPESGGALVTVYSSASGSTLTYRLPGHDIATTPLDAAWTNDMEFLLCGGDVVLCLRCGESSIAPTRKFETKDDDCFTQVAFDWRSKLAATSSEKGILDVRMPRS